ncbi:glycosyltransferase family 2 protein [bacterium]|nr:glycosyltransferase family 2 protein [bacterium]
MADVLIVIPAHNEAENIGAVLEEVRRLTPDCDLVVIDDGSRDGSREVVHRLGVPCIRHPYNLGYGGAVQTGLRYARARGYETVVLMDGDGQHDAGQVPALVEALRRTGADLVIGSRFVERTGYPVPPLRRAVMAFFAGLTWAFTGLRVRDVTSGFQAIDRRAVAFLAEEYPLDYPDAETVILLVRSGFRVVEQRADVRPRMSGASMHSGLRALYYPFRALMGVIIVMLRTLTRPGRAA